MAKTNYILTIAALDLAIDNAQRLQAKANREWERITKACVTEILNRKQAELLDHFAARCKNSTIWNHCLRALVIMTGGYMDTRRNGKLICEYAPDLSLIQWDKNNECFVYNPQDAAETAYVALRAAYKSQWENTALEQIRATDAPKPLTADAFRKLFEKYAENESMWAKADAKNIKAILFALNGIGDIPRRADMEKRCTSTTAKHNGEPTTK